MVWTPVFNHTAGMVPSHTHMNTYLSGNDQYLKDVLDGVQHQTLSPTLASATSSNVMALQLRRARGSLGSPTIVSSGDRLGSVEFYGHDGAAYQVAAYIDSQVDGTPGAGDMPGRMLFLTTPDGSVSPVERLRIDSAGRFLQGTNYAYLGNYNSGGIYPRAGTDLAIGYNFSGGNAEVTFWNTVSSGPTVPFSWQQLTGASSSTELMRLTTTGVLAPGGDGTTKGFAFIADPNTGMFNPSADALAFLVGGASRASVEASSTRYGQTTPWLYLSGAGLAVLLGSATPLVVDRGANDGTLVSLRQDSTEEGTIAVAGTAVAYNPFMGAHYTQLDDGQIEPPPYGVVVATGRMVQSENRYYLEDLVEVIDDKPTVVGSIRHERREGPSSAAWREVRGATKDGFPHVAPTTTPGDKAVYGAWVGKLRADSAGNSFGKTDKAIYNVGGLGLFKVLVTDTGGDIEVGDLLETSARPFHCQRQADDIVRARTLGKAVGAVAWANVPVDGGRGFKSRVVEVVLYAG